MWLATKLIELAESADADNGEAACIDQLTAALAELFAPAEIGLMLYDHAHGMRAGAASTDRARHLTLFEERHREGPCTDGAATSQPVVNQRIAATALRWPVFAQAAEAVGITVVSALPMLRRDQVLGSIGMLGASADGLSSADIDRGQVLAKAATIAILQQREFRQSAQVAGQLQRALDSRVLIEQAKGMIAARLGITPDDAFALLRAFARRESQRLADVAAQAVRGELPALDLAVTRVDRERGRARPRPGVGQSW